ncbi:transposase [Microbispora cellulosiformans]|uniref:Transposase n=1 Tax=Microbispora cellulosiformans TaxID=2614688 RepID=A0A5J5K695_9ACTN|nr:transposase [Microbispora cellulosiformans]KAA9379650.1 transposase [Microbispora cellulosiformans]
MSRWVGVDGWEVAVVELDGRPVFRVRHLGYHICYARSVAGVAQHVDLADLVEVVELRR